MQKIAKENLHKEFQDSTEESLSLPSKSATTSHPQVSRFSDQAVWHHLHVTKAIVTGLLWKVLHRELRVLFQLQRGFGNSWDMLWRPNGLQCCQSAALPREHVLCSFNSFLIILF